MTFPGRTTRSSARMARIRTIAVEFAILCSVSIGVNALATVLRLPVAANALAIVATVAILASGLVKEQAMTGASRFLTRHLTVLFAPIAVGVIRVWPAVAPNAGRFVLVVVVSTAIGLAAAGSITQSLSRTSP